MDKCVAKRMGQFAVQTKSAEDSRFFPETARTAYRIEHAPKPGVDLITALIRINLAHDFCRNT